MARTQAQAAPFAAAERGVTALARTMAVLAGLMMLALALMTVVSITGRALSGLGLGPVRGDYELVANGIGIAVFWMLPWCQLQRGHVTVDLLSVRLPARLHAALGLLGEAALTAAAIVVLRQLWLAFGERLPHGGTDVRGALGFGPPPFFPETTFELQIPVWMLMGAALLGAVVMVTTGLFCTARAAYWVALGREPAHPPVGGA